MPRDSGHRNKPAVPKVGRRVLKDVVPKRKLLDEIPLPPQTLTSDEIEARSAVQKGWSNERKRLYAAKPQEQRETIEEEDRVRAKDYNELDGLLDENNDWSVFDEIPKKNTKSMLKNTKMQNLRACLERI